LIAPTASPAQQLGERLAYLRVRLDLVVLTRIGITSAFSIGATA
jgi:hypothetical protein